MEPFERKGQTFAFDIETYVNAMCFGFKSLETDEFIVFSVYGEDESLSNSDCNQIQQLLSTNRIITFNGLKFDMPITLNAILRHSSVSQIYKLVHKIFGLGFFSQPDKVCKLCRVDPSYDEIDHWDLLNLTEGVGSLKYYGAVLNSPKLQDLPYPPDVALDEAQWAEVVAYNENDCDVTLLIYKHCVKVGDIKIRENLLSQENLTPSEYSSIKSKNPVQIAEVVLLKVLAKQHDPSLLKKQYYRSADLVLPPYLTEDAFMSDAGKRIVNFYQTVEFEINRKTNRLVGLTDIPEVVIGNTTYTFGMGGIHSVDDQLIVKEFEGMKLRTSDVRSYYPAMIINTSAFRPDQNPILLPLYKGYFDTRVRVKHTDKDYSAILKYFLNGTFGKLGEPHSPLYNPSGMLRITVTGQLSLLLLVDQLEYAGISVFSANTDGVEYYCNDDDYENIALPIVQKWEKLTNLVMENETYLATYNRDINNYVAIYPKEVKCKGAYLDHHFPKRQLYPIVGTAIRAYLDSLHKGDVIDPMKLIDDCRDIREFLVVANGKSGVHSSYNNEYIGKTVRFYYNGSDHYFMTPKGNRIANSLHSRGLMDLPADNGIPDDLDINYYKSLVNDGLNNIGVFDASDWKPDDVMMLQHNPFDFDESLELCY